MGKHQAGSRAVFVKASSEQHTTHKLMDTTFLILCQTSYVDSSKKKMVSAHVKMFSYTVGYFIELDLLEWACIGFLLLLMAYKTGMITVLEVRSP